MKPLIKPYPHQQKLIDNLRLSISANSLNAIGVVPTGGGKSVIIQNLVYSAIQKGKRVLVLVPNNFLYDNIAEYLEIFSFGEVKGKKSEFSKKVTISTVATFTKRIEKLPYYFDPDFIIWDEVHHLPSKTWQKVFSYFESRKKVQLGLTATAFRLDGKPLNPYFETIVEGESLRWHIDNGYLSDFQIYTLPHVEYHFDKKQGDYDLQQQESVYNTPTIVGDVVKTWSKLAIGEKSFYFCPSVQSSKTLASEFNRFGLSYYDRPIAAHLDGTSSDRERHEILEKFESGEILILTNFGLFLEGFNAPDCTVIGFTRKTASFGLLLQAVGRGLRIDPNNLSKKAKLLDHVGNFEEHGRPDQRFTTSIEEGLIKESKYVLCCSECEKVLTLDYRIERDEDELTFLLCQDCRSVNLLPKKVSRSRGERKEYEEDTSKNLVLLTKTINQLKMDKLHKKSQEISDRGKNGRGWMVHKIKELDTVEPLTFEEVRYGLMTLLKHNVSFAVNVWKEIEKAR